MNHAHVRGKKGNWLIFKSYTHTSICNSSTYLSHQLLQFRISWTAFLDNQTIDLVGANDITAVCHNVKKWTPITFMETVPDIVCKITSSPRKRSLNNGKKKMQCMSYVNLLVFTTMALYFACSFIFSSDFDVSQTAGLHYSWWLVFLLWCCSALKSLSEAIRRTKHFISIYYRSPHSLCLRSIFHWFSMTLHTC